ncbi:discoidin domain-containing protein [Pyxidicoccus sp. MSG2]|uniref:galactose-binding domain-containing protein n=1 Tax=Pyxidicoccus sp. MSG2 TaxID=2996790 RepID=UPI00226DA282|nr:discoidin domain-containing protein [Pyxidicoccus sp. MSG2]MCY1022726.1 discoidin domain-containing protein [Pyxidicoccus sp. MSG2]
MSRRESRSCWVMLAAALASSPAFADDDITNVVAADRHPVPAVRETQYRNRIAQELGGGGWQVFLGDLHTHPRGHSKNENATLDFTPQIRRSEVLLNAFRHGYDFFGTSNHTTSWEDYDENDPISELSPELDANGQPQLLITTGLESYVGPDTDGKGSSHDYHFNSFNRHVHLNSDSAWQWHHEILNNYSDDPLLSTHVSLNHPSPEVWFTLPTEPDRRQNVRNAIELVEFNGLPTYFEILRRGFRVSPISDSDAHATTREQLAYEFLDHNPDGSFVRPFINEPGVPREKTTGNDVAQGRAGVVLPPGTPWNFANFLTALRNRWTFSTALPAASGFFTVNGRAMGAEFTRGSAERRLDFTVWGTTKDGSGGGGNEWTKLQVWNPYEPDEPVKEIPYSNPALVDLREAFSLTPYAPIYVVTLTQNWLGAEVVMAPIWVTNPIAKPTISFEQPVIPNRQTVPMLFISGGGDSLLLQRSVRGPTFNDWQTVATLPNNYYYPLDPAILPTSSYWRVVDPYQPKVISNVAQLTVANGITVDQPYLPTPPHDGVNVSISWSHPTPLTVDYYASRNNGATWTKVGEEIVPTTSRYWNFYTGGFGNSNVIIKVVDRNDTGRVGVTAPFFVDPQVETRIPATSNNATINAIAAHTVTDSNTGSCWSTSNGNEQSVYIDLGQQHLVKRMEVLFGTNPPGWYMGTSLNGTSWNMQDSGSLTYTSNPQLVRDYSQRSGGGLTARYIRFYASGTFPGLTSSSSICDARFYR